MPRRYETTLANQERTNKPTSFLMDLHRSKAPLVSYRVTELVHTVDMSLVIRLG